MRACRRFGVIALLLVMPILATAFPSRARAEPEHIRIQFSAPPRCPDGAAFIRALRQRTGRFQLATGAEQTRVFAVTITHADALATGRLEIQGPGTEASLRSISGSTCDEVMAALAFMTALAIDPGALAPSAPAPAAPANRTSPASAVSPLPPPASTPSTPSTPRIDREDPPALPSPVTQGSAPSPSAMPVAEPWKWSAGVQGSASWRMSPSAGLGGVLFVEAAAPGAAVLAPVFRAGVFINRSDVTLASGAGADFQWAAAMVEGCPVRLVALDARVALYPCLAFHLGVLRGQGRNLDQPEQTTDLWSALGPVARLRVTLATRLFLEVQGMLVLPLRRLTFDVQDAGPSQAPTTVFTVPALGVLAGIGVSYAFR